jgi:hypothetical protein
MSKPTPAELQMEELRRLRAGLAKAKAPRPPRPRAQAGKENGGAALPLSADLYRELLARQKAEKAFRSRRDMGNWAAELLLALPLATHRLSPEAKAELFQRMQAWAKARGLQ